MPTTTFNIATAPYAFTLETDAGGNLVSLTAVDSGNTWDCLLQLMPRDEGLGIECCRPTGCMSGACSEMVEAARSASK
jgi:hypothetical protein